MSKRTLSLQMLSKSIHQHPSDLEVYAQDRHCVHSRSALLYVNTCLMAEMAEHVDNTQHPTALPSARN